MNLMTEKPENEKESVLQKQTVSAFGLTFQGTSHKQSQPPAPCQDYHDMRWLEREGIFLAAIADGVGSCKLSHWGAYTAVNASLDSAQAAIKAMSGGRKLHLDGSTPSFRQQMKEIMLTAFRTARSAVEQLADSAEPPQPVFAFQSTLTLAIYDGVCLYHGHAGDDGIVAQLPDGTVEMATRRMKGDEANSVYPLQSGEQAWSFGVVPEVSGFVMATDGVLDAFVQSHRDYFGFNYFNGICYAFMEEAMKQLAKKNPGAAEQVKQQYSSYMQSAEYTRQVVDDLTMVAVVSPQMMVRSQKPDFSLELWDTIARESVNAKRRALNHRVSEQQEMAPHTPCLPTETEESPEVFVQPPKRTPPERPRQKASHAKSGLVLVLVTLLVVETLLLGFFAQKLLIYHQHQGENREQIATEYYALMEKYENLKQRSQLNESVYEQQLNEMAQKVAELQRELEKYAPKETSAMQQLPDVEPSDAGGITQGPEAKIPPVPEGALPAREFPAPEVALPTEQTQQHQQPQPEKSAGQESH